MTFELVNHRIKHMFGGLEPQRNSSVEFLECQHRRILKALQRSVASNKKIHKAAGVLKESFFQLSQNYIELCQQTKSSGALLRELAGEFSSFLNDISEEASALARQTQQKMELFQPIVNKIKERYDQSAESFQHYTKKLQLLEKNLPRQAANRDQLERIIRNKHKLTNADQAHDQILSTTVKKYIEVNSDGVKTIFMDLLCLFSKFGGNIFKSANNLTPILSRPEHQRMLFSRLERIVDSPAASAPPAVQDLMELVDMGGIDEYIRRLLEKDLLSKKEAIKIEEIFRNPPRTFQQFQNHYDKIHSKSTEATKYEKKDSIRVPDNWKHDDTFLERKPYSTAKESSLKQSRQAKTKVSSGKKDSYIQLEINDRLRLTQDVGNARPKSNNITCQEVDFFAIPTPQISSSQGTFEDFNILISGDTSSPPRNPSQLHKSSNLQLGPQNMPQKNSPRGGESQIQSLKSQLMPTQSPFRQFQSLLDL